MFVIQHDFFQDILTTDCQFCVYTQKKKLLVPIFFRKSQYVFWFSWIERRIISKYYFRKLRYIRLKCFKRTH